MQRLPKCRRVCSFPEAIEFTPVGEAGGEQMALKEAVNVLCPASRLLIPMCTADTMPMGTAGLSFFLGFYQDLYGVSFGPGEPD